MPTPSDIALNHPAWKQAQTSRDCVIWRHEGGDALGVFRYDVRPNIGADLDDIDGLRASYRKMATNGGGAIVEVDRIEVAGCAAVRTIIKLPQEPQGMCYLGSLTLPFESFSYVVKAQCHEGGPTGMRDSVVFMKVKPPVDEKTGKPMGWVQDPYDPSVTGALRNRADDEEWDGLFPEHPLTRCRRYLGELVPTITLDENVKASAKPFVYVPPKKRWWHFGK